MNTQSFSYAEQRKTLEETQTRLLRGLRQRDGLAIEKSADQMDEVQNASDRDLAIQNADRESTLLRSVREALRRLGDGLSGQCSDCENEIGAKRLLAVPWTTRCLSCQDALDRGVMPASHGREELQFHTR